MCFITPKPQTRCSFMDELSRKWTTVTRKHRRLSLSSNVLLKKREIVWRGASTNIFVIAHFPINCFFRGEDRRITLQRTPSDPFYPTMSCLVSKHDPWQRLKPEKFNSDNHEKDISGYKPQPDTRLRLIRHQWESSPLPGSRPWHFSFMPSVMETPIKVVEKGGYCFGKSMQMCR